MLIKEWLNKSTIKSSNDLFPYKHFWCVILFCYLFTFEVTFAKTTHNIRQCHLFRAVFRVELTSLSKSYDQIWQQFEMTQADEIVSKTTLKEVLNMVHEFSEIKCQKMNEPLCVVLWRGCSPNRQNGKIKSNSNNIILKRLNKLSVNKFYYTKLR